MMTIPFVRSIFEKFEKNWKLLKKLPQPLVITDHVVSARAMPIGMASGWRKNRDADQATADVS